jgi:two-component system phosphate regulon sensor histidine kinase PhoR
MRIRKITWQFFIVFLTILVVALWITTWYAVNTYNRLYVETTIEDVTKRAYLIEREFESYFKNTIDYKAIDSLCKIIGSATSSRLTVILLSGKVVGDSEADPDSMENHANRPEVIQALSNSRGVQKRYSSTQHEEKIYVAMPMHFNNELKSILRVSVSLKAIKKHEHNFYLRMLAVSLVTLLVLIIASYLLSRRLSDPIRHIKNGARRFAAGDFDYKLPIPSGDELGELSKALNVMASKLNERIKIVTHQRNELNAILASMAEGVIALDNEERIMSMNPAAAAIFGVGNSEVKGKWLHEVIRNSAFQRFLKGILSGSTTEETTFILTTPDGDVHIQASGAKLNDIDNAPGETVLVLNDITRLKQLENMRKEFVANISHELRTPLTSIKGFIETINHGSYNLPDEVKQFLEIISSKTERLCAIVDDILSLSSIDRDIEHQELTFADTELKDVLVDSVQTCSGKAKSKKISIHLSVDKEIRLSMDEQLIEQAVVNLIDNAIKYSDEGKSINVTALQVGQSVEICIKDEGIGIPPEHRERIFERFYRVDKARSRKLGGTGLGLSIVKNIAIAHGGHVMVESEIGKGSIFKIILPIKY